MMTSSILCSLIVIFSVITLIKWESCEASEANRRSYGKVLAGKKPQVKNQNQNVEVQIFLDSNSPTNGKVNKRPGIDPIPPNEPIARVIVEPKGKVTLKQTEKSQSLNQTSTKQDRYNSIYEILDNDDGYDGPEWDKVVGSNSGHFYWPPRPPKRRRRIFHHHVTILENTVNYQTIIGALATFGMIAYFYQIYLAVTNQGFIFGRSYNQDWFNWPPPLNFNGQEPNWLLGAKENDGQSNSTMPTARKKRQGNKLEYGTLENWTVSKNQIQNYPQKLNKILNFNNDPKAIHLQTS